MIPHLMRLRLLFKCDLYLSRFLFFVVAVLLIPQTGAKTLIDTRENTLQTSCDGSFHK